MRIAIIGTGISGLTAAYFLSEDHEVVVFEANDYVGGHTNTVDVSLNGQQYAVDTGFIVFNEKTYPNTFIRMWEYYLCYCEGGFAERYIGDVQMLFAKPLYRWNDLQSAIG
jgi:uncharacterized protein with NAD-binding domain and iron-sulfur cluster